nr:WG repeat-containing protein [Bradyrhizobium sp. AUGA SZCCT0177]
MIVIATLIAAAAVGGIIWIFQPQQELLSACIAKERCGYINDEGKFIIAPEFEAANDWTKDAGLVWRGGRVGSIDRDGRYITEPRSSRLTMSGGANSVQVNRQQLLTDYALRPLNSELWDDFYGIKLDRRLSHAPEYIAVGRGGLYGLADGKGRVILEPKYEEIGWRSHEFPLLFKEGNLFGHLAEGGQPISAQRWDAAGMFHNKLASVSRAGKCGYIDRAGLVVIPPAFDECRPFRYSEATIVRKEQSFSLVGRNGVVIRDGLADAGNPSADGMPIAVRVQDKWGALDMKGNFPIAAEFDGVEPLDVFDPEPMMPLGPKTVAFIVEFQGKRGIMDAAGKWILPPRFDQVDNNYEGDGKLATFRDGELWGFVDLETRKATTASWNEVKATSRAVLVPVRVGSKWGYVDAEGNMRISAQFDLAEDFHGVWASVQTGEKWGLIDSKGAQVTPVVFRSVHEVTPERARVTLAESRGWVTRKGRLMGISETDLQKAGLRK